MKRFILPAFLNLLVPGAGLPIIGRPWVGLLLATSFLINGELAILGWLVTPASIPLGLTVLGAIFAVGTWILAQSLLITRIRFLSSADLPRELAILRRLARAAIRRQDYRAASSALAVAFSLDDSDLESHILRATLFGATGQTTKAHRAWATARTLDVSGQHAEEIDRHLDNPAVE